MTKAVPPAAGRQTRTRRKVSRRGPLRPHGRSLNDFRKRSQAEIQLIKSCRNGDITILGLQRPTKPDSSVLIHADLVRFLALGGDDMAPVHERGVLIIGAWIEGELNFSGARLTVPVLLHNCRIESISAENSVCKLFSVAGSRVEQGFSADGLECTAALLLRNGAHISGGVRLHGAKIAGPLDCDRSFFENVGDNAFVADSAEISGAARFAHGFRAVGEVRLLDAIVHGPLDLSGGTFQNVGGDALSLDRVKVSGTAFLAAGFQSHGAVRLLGVKIGGNIELSGGIFRNPGRNAISFDGAKIDGAIFFRRLRRVDGDVRLSSVVASSLCDDLGSWRSIFGHTILDGFRYSRLAGGSRTDAAMRTEWLNLQAPKHVGSDLKPQPWEHLATVLREMGHFDEARTIAIAKHKRMRAAQRYVGGSWLWDWIYGALVGYGYRPWRILWIAAAVWLSCAGAYSIAIRPHLIGAPAPLLVASRPDPNVPCLVERVSTRNITPCPPSETNYRNFLSLAYSAEVLLPVISLGSKAEWKPSLTTPDGQALYWGWIIFVIYWLEIAFGWLAGLLLVAALSNLVKKE